MYREFLTVRKEKRDCTEKLRCVRHQRVGLDRRMERKESVQKNRGNIERLERKSSKPFFDKKQETTRRNL